MKKFVGIALVLALALSTAAMAEGTTDPAPAADSVTAVEAQAPAEEAQAPTEEATETPATEDEQKALKEAMDAYRAAKQDKAVDDLEAELKGYVEAGSLTQEQADLILKNVKERIATMKGQCPNCGYQFSKGDKHHGSMMGQQRGGMMGGQRGQQRGQRGQMPGQQRPDAQSGAAPQGPMNGQQMPQNGQQMPLAPQM